MPEWEFKWTWEKLTQDPQAREDFLQESQPFIRHVAIQTCRRILEWGRDEELSEALIAFNEAIDHFEDKRGVPFLAYARLLIKRRLIDYYRKERLREALPMDEENIGQAVEIHIGINEFRQKEQNQERLLEIKEYSKILEKYGLSFKLLAEVSPKHRDTRENLLRVARVLAETPELWEKVERTGKLPMKDLAQKTQVHPKVLERGRRYILAVALLIANQHDYIYLREYVLPSEQSQGKEGWESE